MEDNERKVGIVRFKPINNGSPKLEAKGLNRLPSTKLVKRKKNKQKEPDTNDTVEIAESGEENGHSSELSPQKRLEDSKFYATVEKGDDGYDSNSQQ